MTKRKLIVTTSWDDGYPADLKLAELLAKYGAAGTFYVPNRNSEGRPVMTESEVRKLSTTFEVGGHSVDHVVLTDLTLDQAKRQVRENKQWLQDVTSKPVQGFCYVRGRYNRDLADIVRQAGYEYARTVENLNSDANRDPFQMPTTIQLYPHSKLTYLKNFARGPLGIARARLLWVSITSENLSQRIDRLIELCENTGGYFHLWGHSWEIEEQNLWDKLEAILRRLAAASASIEFLTNYQVYSKMADHNSRRPPTLGPR